MTTHTSHEPPRQHCGGCGGIGGGGAPTPCRCCETEDRCDLECLERPLFTPSMVLSDTDLTALVDWTAARLGLNRRRHGWGVVCGLDVHCDPDHPGSVVVEPGYAVGCCGEDIVLCEPQAVDLTACCVDTSPCGQPGEPATPGQPATPGEPATPGTPAAPGASATPGEPTKYSIPGMTGAERRLGSEGARCGDVVVDVVLSPLASPAVPELVDQCGCGRTSCDRRQQVAPTRLREGGLVEPVHVTPPSSDPAGAAAKRAQAAYQDCHKIVSDWVDVLSGREDEADSAGYEKAPPLTSRQVAAWLAMYVEDPPCDWWKTTCAALDAAEQAKPADGEEPDEPDRRLDEVLAGALLDLVVACRHRQLRRSCDTCTTERVGLARAWLRRVEDRHGTTCVVTRVDAYAPHRRELRLDSRPVPAGAEDLAPFIWQRWDQVCHLWRRLAPTTPPALVPFPMTTRELLEMLDDTVRLCWLCGEEAPEPVLVVMPCLGLRVLGFRKQHVISDGGDSEPPEESGAQEGASSDRGLEEVSGIGPRHAKKLTEAGTTTPEQLSTLEPAEIARTLGVSQKSAEAIRASAQTVVGPVP